ncbi:MAG TPA: alkaline phosphatase family protein [Jatrophihabitantaceae bacterium]|jgi:phospholipase C
MTDRATGFTRRRFLGAAAATGGATMGMMALPPNLRKALAAPAPGRNPSLRDIEHVVLLMQENRSFDHYFGTMSGVAGFSDPHAIRLPTGRSVFYQPTDTTPDGYLLPFHLDSRHTSAQWITSAGGYSWPISHAAWNGGKMDSWLPASYAMAQGDKMSIPLMMGYFEEEDVPFHRALADAFTICDHYHCSLLGPTSPNRIMWETGTVDPNGAAGGPILGNENVVKTWKTYAESLTDAGVSWKFYQVEGGMASATHLFKAFREAPTSSPLYQNSQLVPTGQFEYDALHDRLPTVSWLWPGPGQNEHPNEGIPAAGAQFIAGKIDAIDANPDVWAKTVFVVVWDENGGLFDHVPPPTPPPGTPDEFVIGNSPTGIPGGGLPVGAGFRVGCIIVSPWTAGGWVCSEPFDHTSNLRFLERVTGVRAPNISAWRRETFGDFTSAFRFHGHPAQPPALPDTTGNLALAQYEIANLPAPAAPARQVLPRQEPGRRPITPPHH